MASWVSIVKQIKRFLYTKESFILFLAFFVRVSAFCLLWWWFRGLGHTPDPGYLFPVLGGDSSSYFDLSENLRQNGVFSLSTAPPFIPESFRLPGYPFFLYIFTFIPGTYITAMVVQMILSAASCVLLFFLGKKFLSEKVGFVGAILFSLEPTSILFSTTIMSDTLFVFLLLLGIYLLLQNPKRLSWSLALSFAAGILFGYAVLVRVMAQFLIPCLLMAYLFIFRKDLFPLKKTFIRFALVVVGALLVLLPWALRQHYWFNTYTLSSTQYINFTQYNLVYFYAYQHGITPQEAQHVYSDPILYPFGSPGFNSLLNEPIFKQQMREGLEGNILPYAQFHLIKTLPFFINDSLRDINRMIGIFPPSSSQINFTDLLIKKDFGSIFNYFKNPQPTLWMLLVGSSIWIAVSLLCFFVFVYSAIKKRREFWFIVLCLGVILYFGVLSSPVIQPRYRMPAAPFMLLLAAEGVMIISQLLLKRHPRAAR